jgi:hypothetical protein
LALLAACLELALSTTPAVIGAFGNAEADDSDDDGEPDERDFDPALGHSEMQRELSNALAPMIRARSTLPLRLRNRLNRI